MAEPMIPKEILALVEETYFIIKELALSNIPLGSVSGVRTITKHTDKLLSKIHGNKPLAIAIVSFASTLVLYKIDKVFH